ncbi:hypothetical protein HSX11_09415 [Oxalobacteraceae bacterium]|nr:hypothetical protein [Oxalobacteraceae bacterium]
MYELRILNGLHRGAALPLDGQPLLIGASDAADVVLVDPGIAARHATLTPADGGWLLTAHDGTLFPADSALASGVLDLAAGEHARLGPIWLTVAHQDSAWEEPPASVPAFGAKADEDAPAWTAPPAGRAVTARAPRTARRRRAALALAVALLSCAAAYAITGKSEPVADTHARPAALDGLPAAARRPAQPVAAAISIDAAPADAAPAPASPSALVPASVLEPASAPVLTGEALRSAFRKRLADADLLKRFDLDLQDQQWLMKGALDDEEADRFARILTGFVKQQRIGFHISAKIGSGETMLPFKIQQVISGANASLITQDGERIYVGDEYQGVRLVAIQANQLSFSGKRKIEVKW